MKPAFSPGGNIAIKTPAHEFEDMVAFYGDVLGFERIEADSASSPHSARFRFGDKLLWIDRVDGMSQAEIWLEIITDDIDSATAHFASAGFSRCDEIEPLAEGLQAFWLAGPSNLIHLVRAA